jgi:hypothetical protein
VRLTAGLLINQFNLSHQTLAKPVDNLGDVIDLGKAFLSRGGIAYWKLQRDSPITIRNNQKVVPKNVGSAITRISYGLNKRGSAIRDWV